MSDDRVKLPEPGFNSYDFDQKRDLHPTFDHPWWLQNGQMSKKMPVFDANCLAMYIIERHNAIRVNGRLILTVDGKFRTEPDVLSALVTYYDCGLSLSQRREVCTRITDYVSLEKLDRAEADPRYIAFSNGILDVATGQLVPGTGDRVILNAVPFAYDPAAACPDVDRMLDSVTLGKADLRELIEEMVGYCLYRSLKLRKFFILTGGKRNGKSTFLDFLAYALGAGNVSSLALSDYQERFSRVRLFGKLANIGDDIDDAYVRDAALIRKLISGEAVQAEEKGQPVFFFRSYATSIFSANDIPQVNDPTGALIDRMVIIPFDAYFTEEDADLGLADRLATPAAAQRLLALGVAALRRLLVRGTFAVTADVADLVQETKRDNDPFVDWLAGYDPLWHELGEVYASYTEYCDAQGLDVQLRLRRGTLVKKVDGALMTYKHQYSNFRSVIEPRSAKGHSPEEVRAARAAGWTGRKPGAPNDMPAIVPFPAEHAAGTGPTPAQRAAAESAAAALWAAVPFGRPVEPAAVRVPGLSAADVLLCLEEAGLVYEEGGQVCSAVNAPQV